MRKAEFRRYKSGWTKSFIEGFSQDELGLALPWMTYGAIEFLNQFLHHNHRIFEFGLGSSTLFFAKRVKSVISLETNPEWAWMVNEKLAEQNSQNVEITLMENGIILPQYETFPKSFEEKFDLIIVDSIKRFECSKNSVDALKPGGVVILDDSERKHYQKIFDFFADRNFLKQDFIGISPGQLRIKKTTMFFDKAL